jgi:hypothetical protein
VCGLVEKLTDNLIAAPHIYTTELISRRINATNLTGIFNIPVCFNWPVDV